MPNAPRCADGPAFAVELRHYRQRAGLSCSALARLVKLDPSFLSRTEQGGRGAPHRDKVEDIARALRLSSIEQMDFLLAAGFAPERLARAGWDAALEDVLGVLDDPEVDGHARRAFREAIATLALCYRPGPSDGVRVELTGDRLAGVAADMRAAGHAAAGALLGVGL